MSDPEQEQTKALRSTEKNRFRIGVGLATLFFGAAGNILVLLAVVPKFEQIYRDALPSVHLPTVTQFIISARIALVIIALGWPILGTVLVGLQKSYAILWINVGFLWNFLQLGITIFALFRPMIGLDGGMGEGR